MKKFNLICILFFILFISVASALPTPAEWKAETAGKFFTLTKDEVDSFIAPLITYNLSKGLIVVMVDSKGYNWYSYGDISTEFESFSDNTTLFEIGSISKVMTGLLMADAEIRGNYSLSAPVNNWLSQECYLPGYEGIEITGAHLATHYSGLPGTPDIFSQVNPANANEDQIEESIQKYQTMTAESVYQWVTKTTLYAPPGYQYLYSNLGAAIAGDIVSRAEDSSYPELLTSRLFEPLGMENSGALWSIEDLYKRATGYRGYAYPTDKAHLIMFNNFWTATGGIHSNADDMAIFLAAQLGLVDAPLADAIAKTHTPLAIVTKDPSGFEQGIFWDILHNRDATTIIKKAGETTAHQATIAFNPAEKTGVVILSNTATVGGTHVEEQAIALLERMHVKTPMMAH